MPPIPDCAPTELRAGDTARWNRSIDGFPASEGWTLSYTLVTGTAAHSFSASADGDDFSIEVAGTATAAWAAGRYQLQEYVTNGTQRYTIAVTPLRILPNLAAAPVGGLEARSHARIVLDNINAWLENKAPTAASFEFNGRRLQNYPIPELLLLRDRYRAEVAREEQAASGGVSGRLLVRL